MNAIKMFPLFPPECMNLNPSFHSGVLGLVVTLWGLLRIFAWQKACWRGGARDRAVRHGAQTNRSEIRTLPEVQSISSNKPPVLLPSQQVVLSVFPARLARIATWLTQ